MAEKLELEIVTPEKRVLEEVVDEVVLPGKDGELGILPEHTPLISQLQTGVLTYRKGGERKSVFVSGGFAEVLPGRVSVLTDVSELPSEIDVARAQRARETAEKAISASTQGDSAIDLKNAQLKLQRAIARMELAQKTKSS
jgi:F-type H+-transporting ATPase subunit epsilon